MTPDSKQRDETVGHLAPFFYFYRCFHPVYATRLLVIEYLSSFLERLSWSLSDYYAR